MFFQWKIVIDFCSDAFKLIMTVSLWIRNTIKLYLCSLFSYCNSKELWQSIRMEHKKEFKQKYQTKVIIAHVSYDVGIQNKTWIALAKQQIL